MESQTARVVFGLENNAEWPVSVLIEPWADIFVLNPAETVEVVWTGAAEERVDLEIRNDFIVIYGGRMVRVYKDGREICGP